MAAAGGPGELNEPTGALLTHRFLWCISCRTELLEPSILRAGGPVKNTNGFQSRSAWKRKQLEVDIGACGTSKRG